MPLKLLNKDVYGGHVSLEFHMKTIICKYGVSSTDNLREKVHWHTFRLQLKETYTLLFF